MTHGDRLDRYFAVIAANGYVPGNMRFYAQLPLQRSRSHRGDARRRSRRRNVLFLMLRAREQRGSSAWNLRSQVPPPSGSRRSSARTR